MVWKGVSFSTLDSVQEVCSFVLWGNVKDERYEMMIWVGAYASDWGLDGEWSGVCIFAQSLYNTSYLAGLFFCMTCSLHIRAKGLLYICTNSAAVLLVASLS